MNKLHLSAALAAIALGSVAVYAQRFDLAAEEPAPAALQPSTDTPLSVPGERRLPTPNLPNDYGVTHAEVGDADSFGRPARWLGMQTGYVTFSASCPRAGAPAGELCHALGPYVTAATQYNFAFPQKVMLPARATQSVLCQWTSPVVDVTFQSGTNVRRNGTFWFRPWVIVESQVLNDVINPSTGQSYGGRLRIDLYSQQTVMGRSIEPNATWREAHRNSQTCVNGLISRKVLIESYGFSEDDADRFFQAPMELQFGVAGGAQHVSAAYLSISHRLMGD